MMPHFIHENLKNKVDKPAIRSELYHLAKFYIHKYKPLLSTLLKKFFICERWSVLN